ncbi:dienelactone hydrolase family protein [Kribbella albertanoniae]|uniref:Dienelactone hydrolase family protein n=1 Tax=Kribbella albertanoniae TaxID=1266829 RepID=A0A4R4PCZ7_9ACTN|nr:dienelactone hydrolase family protein [Kribbella albertanoniae]TDC18973.1 dienelactone hydrolase family protein [Kribbella albertanoniae]
MTLEIDTASGLMPVHEWGDPDSSAPGILLLQEIFGVSPYIEQRAADLAALGYYVIAPEIYWRLDDVDLDEDADDLLERAIGTVQRLDWDLAVTDSVAALEYLRSRDRRTGLIGFCFGGGLAFNVAAVAPADALVSYYGSALPNLLQLAPDVTAPSLHHFGDADEYLPVDEVVPGLPGTEIHRYPGAGHAFDNPMPAFHDIDASALAWERTVEFLSRNLQGAA